MEANIMIISRFVSYHRLQYLSVSALALALSVIIGLPATGVFMLFNRENRTSWMSNQAIFSTKNIGKSNRVLVIDVAPDQIGSFPTEEKATPEKCAIGIGSQLDDENMKLARSFDCDAKIEENAIPDAETAIVIRGAEQPALVAEENSTAISQENNQQESTSQTTNIYIMSIYLSVVAFPSILVLLASFRLFSGRWNELKKYVELRGIDRLRTTLYASGVNIVALATGFTVSILPSAICAFLFKNVSWDGQRFNWQDSVAGFLGGTSTAMMMLLVMVLLALAYEGGAHK